MNDSSTPSSEEKAEVPADSEESRGASAYIAGAPDTEGDVIEYSDTPTDAKVDSSKETAEKVEKESEPSEEDAPQKEEGGEPEEGAEKSSTKEPAKEETISKKLYNEKDGLVRSLIGERKKLEQAAKVAEAKAAKAEKDFEAFKVKLENKNTPITEVEEKKLDTLEKASEEKGGKLMDMFSELLDVVEELKKDITPIKTEFHSRNQKTLDDTVKTVQSYASEHNLTDNQLDEMAALNKTYEGLGQTLTLEELHKKADPDYFKKESKPAKKSDATKIKEEMEAGAISGGSGGAKPPSSGGNEVDGIMNLI